LQKKEKREAIEEERKAAFLERRIEAEETSNKIKMELEDIKIRENRAIEESKLKMELEKLEMDDKEKARQHEINLKHLDQNLPVVTDPIQNDSFRLSAAIKFVPPFDDVDMTKFLNAFEKAMTIHTFPKDKCSVNPYEIDDRNYSDKPEKTFHKNGGRGTFHQKYHHKGNNNHKTAVPVTKNWAPEVLCIRCGRGGHTASVCYAKKPIVHPQTQMQNTAFDTAPKTIALVTKHPNLQLCRENQGLVHTNLAPFCVNATLCTNKGTRRPVILLRDSGALQSLVSKNVSTPEII